MAPPELRGTLIATNNLALSLGLLLSVLFCEFCSGLAGGWRVVYLCGSAVAVCQHVGFLFYFPESPLWLAEHGRAEEARTSLRWLRQTDKVQPEASQLPMERPEWSIRVVFGSAIRDACFRKALRLGVALQATQQLVGINSVMYYAGEIFHTAGFTSTSGALMSTLIVQGVNFVCTVYGMHAVESVGRRPLLVASLATLMVGLVVLAIAFASDGLGRAVLSITGLCIYVIGFAPGVGPVPFTVNAEIYEAGYRSVGVAIATGVNWVCNCIVASAFLRICNVVGASGAFMLFFLFGACGLYYIVIAMPETKGKALDDIPKLFTGEGGEGGGGGAGYSALDPGGMAGVSGPSTPRGKDVFRAGIQRIEVAGDSPATSPAGSPTESPRVSGEWERCESVTVPQPAS